jgi:carbamoyltransferase
MNILGISCYSHNSAACLVKDGIVVASAEEERFNRIKNTSVFPIQAINYCLQQENLTINDVEYIGFYEKPYLKFERILLNHIKSFPFSLREFLGMMPAWLEEKLVFPIKVKKDMGYEGNILYIKHHLSHASSAFYVSPFEESAILTADGVGERATITMGFGKGIKIEILKEMTYPNSLGLLYRAITNFLGFKADKDEDKVMALSCIGEPKFVDKFRDIIRMKSDGSFSLDEKFFNFKNANKMYTNKLISTLGQARFPEDKIDDRHHDIAASLQKIAEGALIGIARNLFDLTHQDKLCLAGGVFLNSIINRRLLLDTPFKEIFIQPAVGNNGGALGVTSFIYHDILNNPRIYRMSNSYLGPEFSSTQIKRFLINKQAVFTESNPGDLVKIIADKLSRNKIIGWFQKRMEFGTNALGNRSILANPCSSDMKLILNKKIGIDEKTQIPSISILLEELYNYFDLNCESPFKLLAAKVKDSKKNQILSAFHNSGLANIQTLTKKENGIFYDLVSEFGNLTGIPMLLNSSFNINDEPIVCSPQDAYDCFERVDLDYLVLDDFIIEKSMIAF